MPKTASVRLSKQPRTELQDAIVPKKRREVVQPDPSIYGVYNQATAQYLANNPGTGETGRIGTQLQLEALSRAENARYSRDVAAANEAQRQLARQEAIYGIYGDIGKRNPEYTKLGMGGAEHIAYDAQGNPHSTVDQVPQQVSNANVLNTDQADRFGEYAGAIKTLRDAGVAIPDTYLGQLLTPPTQKEPVPVTSGTTPLTPSDATQRYAADEGLTAEQQLQVAQLRKAKDDGDDIEYSIETGEGGVAKVVVKGSPEALIKHGYDPATGEKVRPNADADGGAASATTATKTSSTGFDIKTALPIASQFGRVTSTTRTPQHNREVGGVPNSYHLKGQAIDIARNKGIKHSDIVKAYRDAGFNIVEQIDEGDHTHIAFGGGPQHRDTTAMYLTRLKAIPTVVSAIPNADGSILVTTRSGKQMVFMNGKRIG